MTPKTASEFPAARNRVLDQLDELSGKALTKAAALFWVFLIDNHGYPASESPAGSDPVIRKLVRAAAEKMKAEGRL